ncbi:MAG: hypothetical protein ACE5HL_12515 [Terriglobia bacterium]
MDWSESRYARLKGTLDHCRKTFRPAPHIERMYQTLEWQAWCEEFLATPTQLTQEEAELFVDFVLEETATRKEARHRALPGMAGERISRQGVIRHLRDSDLVERVYVCVEALQRAGLNNKEACFCVADHPLLRERFGKSKRGRPDKVRRLAKKEKWSLEKAIEICKSLEAMGHLKDWQQPEPLRKMETVRSRYNSYKKRHPYSDWAFPNGWTMWQFERYRPHPA